MGGMVYRGGWALLCGPRCCIRLAQSTARHLTPQQQRVQAVAVARAPLNHWHAHAPPCCRFLEKVALHIAKNFLMDAGAFDNMCRTPLILGIWGGKGQGKSFQTELCFKKLG